MLTKRIWLVAAFSSLLTILPASAVPAGGNERRQSGLIRAAFSKISRPAAKPSTPNADRAASAPNGLSILPSVVVPPAVEKARQNYKGPAVFPNDCTSSDASLPQRITNGGSIWGTLKVPTFPEFLSGGKITVNVTAPWGDRTARDTNYYNRSCVPTTGRTRRYTFTISEQTIAPDGFPKPGVVINGQYPGPAIEADWGDWIEVKVINKLAEGTAMHYHGFLHRDAPYYDGTPAITQCPIAPGSSLTYRFRADLYGSSWYHSHYSGQYAGGALGPMIIHGPNNAKYDLDLGPVMLQDWFHKDYRDLVRQVIAPGFPPRLPISDNILINGKMNFACAPNETCTPNAGVAKFQFQTGKTHRLRVINTSADGTYKFSIDNHNLTVIANDFVEIEPYSTNIVTLGVGQRADILVTATGQSTDAVYMRADIVCSPSVVRTAAAIVYYDGADTSSIPTTTSSVTPADLTNCGNDPLAQTRPFFALKPDANPPISQRIDIRVAANASGFALWTMNNSTFRGDFNAPLLLDAKRGRTNFSAERNVLDAGDASSIRLVVYNYFPITPHPMHMHGHNVFVLAEGWGEWDGTVTNPDNPQRRDTQMVRAARLAPGSAPGPGAQVTPAFIVLQIEADNPGVWPLHCHSAWHASGGLFINILERPAEIARRPMPPVMLQTCREWWRWTDSNVVDQIDSGL